MLKETRCFHPTERVSYEPRTEQEKQNYRVMELLLTEYPNAFGEVWKNNQEVKTPIIYLMGEIDIKTDKKGKSIAFPSWVGRRHVNYLFSPQGVTQIETRHIFNPENESVWNLVQAFILNGKISEDISHPTHGGYVGYDYHVNYIGNAESLNTIQCSQIRAACIFVNEANTPKIEKVINRLKK
jgi:hypothetical protein